MDSICRIARDVNFLALFLVFCSFSNPSRASPGFQFVNNTRDLVAKQLDIAKLLSFTTTRRSVSNQCNNSLVSLSKNPESLLLYLDAWGKPPSGILAGNILESLGSYSECTKMIEGAHYCLVEIDIAVVLNLTRGLSAFGKALDKIKGLVPYFPYTSWGICAPQQCTEQDITEGLKDFFTVLNLTGSGQNSIKSVHCNKRAEYTTTVITTLVLCGLILTLCLVATTIDIFLSFVTTQPSPVKRHEGCLPVSCVSMAIHRDDTFYVRNSLGDNITGSIEETTHTTDSTSLILPPTPIGHTHPVKPSAVIRMFLCFSIIQNTNRILDTEVSPDAITPIHGMRVLSMWWIILGHTFYFMCFLSKNFMGNALVTYPELIRRSTFEVILNATLSVDSFFFLSGLLVVYVNLRHMEKRNGNLSLFQFYLHRFLRLTPTYMFVLLFNNKILGFLGEGPFWFEFRSKVRDCSKYWWTNLLYINNFYPTRANNMCMPWTWFVAVDMQFYIIAPLVLCSAYRFRLRGLLAIVGLLMTASFVTTAVIVARYDVQGTPSAAIFAHIRNSTGDEMSLVYVKPYCRIAPYLIGMTLGYLLLCKKDWKRSKVCTYFFNVAGWCAATTLALLTLYGPDKNDRIGDRQPFTRLENIMYVTFARSAWSLAIAWVIFACQRGLGGLVDKLLSAGFWIPFSRLTYCAYLVHPIVLNTVRGTQETVNTYSDVHLVCLFAGVLTISYGVAFVVSVCVEFPMIQLESMLRDGKK